MSTIEHIKPKLARLKLSGIANSLEERLKEAKEGKWAYSHFFDLLLADEIDRRDHKQMGQRLAKSRLEANRTLETFDFGFNGKIYEPLIRELGTCNFIPEKECVFLIGQSGVGKSHLAQGLGHEAIRKGYEVLFYRTYHLFQWIQSGRGDGTHRKRIEQIIKVPLLILDDFGLQELNLQQQDDLYEVVCERYEKRPIIITSNRDFSEWYQVFSNPLIAGAAIDRLIHKATKIVLEGKSFRANEFLKKNKRSVKHEK